MVDVIFGLDGGELPGIVVSDTASYSDVVFGLLELLGISYRPALADLPDQKGWRIKADADPSRPSRRALRRAARSRSLAIHAETCGHRLVVGPHDSRGSTVAAVISFARNDRACSPVRTAFTGP
jgi:hypothetical protein